MKREKTENGKNEKEKTENGKKLKKKKTEKILCFRI